MNIMECFGRNNSLKSPSSAKPGTGLYLQQPRDTIAPALTENEQQMMLFKSKPTCLLTCFLTLILWKINHWSWWKLSNWQGQALRGN